MIAIVILRGYRGMSGFILVLSTRTPGIMNLGEQETGSCAEWLIARWVKTPVYTWQRDNRIQVYGLRPSNGTLNLAFLILFDENGLYLRLKLQLIRLHYCLFSLIFLFSFYFSSAPQSHLDLNHFNYRQQVFLNLNLNLRPAARLLRKTIGKFLSICHRVR
jgi:hypothetical protein